MSTKHIFILIVAVTLFSCKKEKGTTLLPPPMDPPPVLLKEIVIPRLPSPYYHFEYNADGKPRFASFASDFTRYDIIYNGGRIAEMRNNIFVNKDTLRYFYDNEGRVNGISYINGAGETFTRISLTYDGQKLVKLEREKKSDTGLVLDKILTMTYNPDGNLLDITYHYLPFTGQTETAYTIRFAQYDNKINVDDFDLLHNEFFDHLVFLPGVRLQKNNPGIESLSGDASNYTVNYTYTYNDKNAPLIKKGDLVFTSGTDTGKHYETNSFYSYY